MKQEVTRILSRTGEADAFRILDELRTRLGSGPFLSPNRVQAALLALESTGQVTAHRNGPRIRYSLG